MTFTSEPWLALRQRAGRSFYRQVYTFFSCGDLRQIVDVTDVQRFGDALCAGSVEIRVSTLPPGLEFDTHDGLTRRSRDWLHRQGYANVQGEMWYPGGRSDLTLSEICLAVECGGTRADKVGHALHAGWRAAFVPYEPGASVLGYPEGTVFVFEARPGFAFTVDASMLEEAADTVGAALDAALKLSP